MVFQLAFGDGMYVGKRETLIFRKEANLMIMFIRPSISEKWSRCT